MPAMIAIKYAISRNNTDAHEKKKAIDMYKVFPPRSSIHGMENNTAHVFPQILRGILYEKEY